jgi:hypothetical protein
LCLRAGISGAILHQSDLGDGFYQTQAISRRGNSQTEVGVLENISWLIVQAEGLSLMP